MRYIPHTQQDIEQMLAVIGAASLDDLFADIHEKFPGVPAVELPAPMGEPDLWRHLEALADRNELPINFAGAGIYEHFVPAAVGEILARSEFYTAYTPYQAEVSQGTLQAAFEFQTLICQLTGMEVANASLYDGATAVAEAILMARRLRRRPRILVSAGVHPDYREVCATYLATEPDALGAVGLGEDGRSDLAALEAALGDDVAAVVVQHPNFLGCLEDLEACARLAHDRNALLIAAVSEPLAYGLLRPPGELGADIVCGEAQSFGVGMQLGGPGLGIFAARSEFLRQLPGRLVGVAHDAAGRRGFVVTLATREQHIRRAKATSNICTNHFLCALAATVYLCLTGKEGLRELARLNLAKAEYAKERLAAVPGYELRYGTPTFNEFVLRCPRPAAELVGALSADGVVPGVDLGRFEPGRADQLLVCTTETRSREEIDALADALGRHGGRS